MDYEKINQLNAPFFSIIIPVYNGLSHDLSICLDSIWTQPIDASLYEVICVDDCSTDGTCYWLNEQTKLHSNLVVIRNSVNIRQGGGRNRGVRESNGKYIAFIDQDDYYHVGALSSIYSIISERQNLEILVCDSAYQFKGHESNKLQLNLPFREICTGFDFIQKNGAVFAPWRMIIQRSFYEKNLIQFTECCRIEDVDWACEVLFYAIQMQYLPILLVHYNKAESSQTDNMYRQKEILQANIIAGNRTLKLSETLYKTSPCQKIIENIADSYYNQSCRSLFGMFQSVSKKRELIRLIRIDKSRFLLVNFALKHSISFCIITNLSVPFFRIIRMIHRRIKAILYEG